ncbi:MAG TPA: cupin domain-containing protein [Calditrichia bacterium]|nr:cupin domain-containing protein [Calditrichia bacterium]
MIPEERQHPSFWVEKLALQPHPEGGFFREIYRSADHLGPEGLPERYRGESRTAATGIYFLLTSESFSAFHRVNSDEAWHFYWGAPLTLYMIDQRGNLTHSLVGANPENEEVFQAVVPAGTWFAAAVNRPGSFSLVGCTVAPGFEFADFELAERQDLIRRFPAHQSLIERFTRLG